MDEVKQVGLKDELLERANILENDSRGWFEEDEELQARLKEVRYKSPSMCVQHLQSCFNCAPHSSLVS